MFIEADDLVGQVLEGRYKLEKEIGRGGMGVVFRAYDSELPDEPLAVKVLMPPEALDISPRMYRELLIRFNRERATLAQLRHENIVPIYYAGQHEKVFYFVMKYFGGGTLSRKLRQKGRFTPEEALTYIRQAASALHYIHFHGIVHRDVKPRNFLLDTEGRLVLSDFGVAHVIGSTLTRTGEFWGAAAYASPEAKQGAKPDRRDDIYSLGVVLFELLTGEHPEQVNQPHPAISPAVAAVIRKATAPYRQGRYKDAEEMARALEFAIRGIPENVAEGTARENRASREEGFQPPEEVVPDDTFTPPRPVRRSPAPGRQRNAPLSSAIARKSHFFARSFSRFLLSVAGILCLVFLFGYIAVHLFPAQIQPLGIFPLGSGDTPTVSSADEAVATVKAYYDDWNKGNYRAAYNLLQSNYQSMYSYPALLAYYTHTHHSCIAITNASMLSDGSVKVAVTDNAIEDDANGTGTVINSYMLDFLVKQENSVWRLMPEHLRLVSTHGVCNAV